MLANNSKKSITKPRNACKDKSGEKILYWRAKQDIILLHHSTIYFQHSVGMHLLASIMPTSV